MSTPGTATDGGRVGRLVGTVRTVLTIARDRQLTFLAASVAYYAFVSVIPALLLAVAVASTVGGEVLVERVIAATGDFLTPTGQETVTETLQNASGRTGATVVGIAVLLWGALKVFRGLEIAFSAVYGIEQPPSLVREVRNAAVVLSTVGLGVAVMVIAGALLAMTAIPHGRGVLGFAFLLVALTVVFLPLYVVFSPPSIGVRKALPGTAVAAVGWVVLQALFQVYAAAAPRFDLYGVLGGILLLVTWFYLAAIVLLLGAVINHVRRPESAVTRSPNPSARTTPMDEDGADGAGADADPDDLRDDLHELRADLEAFEAAVEDRTLHRADVEANLRRYVRKRIRRGHARGWGPYLVLLYGTVMTIGAFYFLAGGWAVLAMILIWLSTLGLYVIMVIVGVGLGALSAPKKAVDVVRDRRS